MVSPPARRSRKPLSALLALVVVLAAACTGPGVFGPDRTDLVLTVSTGIGTQASLGSVTDIVSISVAVTLDANGLPAASWTAVA